MKTQLLNAQIVYRLVMLKLSGNIGQYQSYSSLKKRLNDMSTFSTFLYEFAENWNQMETNQQVFENPELHQVTPVPKRNRIDWFNNNENGKRMRLSEGNHLLVQRAEVQRCLICRANTTCKCKTCTVPLCRFPFGRNRKSCWIKFHNDKKIDRVGRAVGRAVET